MVTITMSEQEAVCCMRMARAKRAEALRRVSEAVPELRQMAREDLRECDAIVAAFERAQGVKPC